MISKKDLMEIIMLVIKIINKIKGIKNENK